MRLLIALLLQSLFCFSMGFQDYELNIGDGYKISRANNMDVGISKADGTVIFTPLMFANVGPVNDYITTQEFIFTRNLGKNGWKIDDSQEWYFIISKKSDKLYGPFSSEEFLKRSEIFEINKNDWKRPENPNDKEPRLTLIKLSLIMVWIYLFHKGKAIAVLTIVISIIIWIFVIKKRKDSKNKIS